MFYFDDKLKKYEKEYSWDKSLIYLEKMWSNQKDSKIINSLVGFSWYYLIEGPIHSQKYDKDENNLSLEIWRKYLKIGFDSFNNNSNFCFIAGYTLLMDGFLIKEYSTYNHEVGLNLLQKAKNMCNKDLKKLCDVIIAIQMQKKYKPLRVSREVMERIFLNDCLLDKYLKEMYS